METPPAYTKLRPLLIGVTVGIFLLFGGVCTTVLRINARDIPVRQDGILEFVLADGRLAASITVEIADSPETRSRGLMGRHLPDFTAGMLFIYSREEPRSFWMHATPTPLDIVFVSEQRRVIHIAKRTLPMSDQTYPSTAPAKYVVEVRAGFTDRFGIKTGTLIRWRLTQGKGMTRSTILF